MFLYFVWKARKLGELGLEEPVVEEARHNDVTFDRERGSLAKRINGNGKRETEIELGTEKRKRNCRSLLRCSNCAFQFSSPRLIDNVGLWSILRVKRPISTRVSRVLTSPNHRFDNLPTHSTTKKKDTWETASVYMYVCMYMYVCVCVYLKYADVWDIRWVEIWNKDGSIVIIQKSYRRSRNSLLAPAIFSLSRTEFTRKISTRYLTRKHSNLILNEIRISV